MPDTDPLNILNAWRVASEEATKAEQAIFDAHLRSIDGSCEPPSREAESAAERLRAHATTLFHMALEEMARVNAHADSVIATLRLPRKSTRTTEWN
jgi:hypothetical protein